MNYSILTYILISFLILVVVSKISYKFKLVDIPNKRKKHSKPTPYTGGLALSIIYIFLIFFLMSILMSLI